MFAFLVVAVFAGCWLVYKMKRRRMEKFAERIPGDNGYPIIGHALAYRKRNTNDLMKMVIENGRKHREYGIYKSWVGWLLVIGVTHPKYIEAIANSPHAVKKGPIIAALLQGISKGVFTTNDIPTWRMLRKPLTKRLLKKHLQEEYHQVFLKKSKIFAEYFKEKKCGNEVNVKKEFQKLTMDIFSGNFLGVETNELEENKFTFLHYAIQFIEESFGLGAILKMFKIFDFMQPLTMSNQMKKAETGALKLLSWVLEERMKQKNAMAEENVYYPDFLLKRKLEQSLTMYDIQRELIDVVFAGTDTTAVALSCALLFLAMFPEIQEEAYQEQVSIFGENSEREPTPEDLDSMDCLSRVIKETIRFCSPPMILKYSTGDIQLDDYTIPNGSIIVIIIDVVCFDDRYWEKPREFYPDHFLSEKEAERPTYAFPVFGFGPRICPGIQYAMNSMKTILSTILRNFILSTSIKFEDLNFEYNLMREFNTYMVKFEERTN